MFMCPCMDTTNGFTTSGICVAPMKCQASAAEGMPPMLPMLPMPMPMPSQPSDQGQGDPCAQSFINGSSSSTKGGEASSTCSSYYGQTQSFDTSGYSSYFSNISSGSTGASDFKPDTNGVTSLLNNTGASTGGSSQSTQTSATIVPGGSTNASNAAPAAPFGSKEGVSGDVQMQGAGVHVLASNRDSARGTQVSGFYGFQARSGVTAAIVFKNLCALRPWSSNFISFIVPSAYFDSLCTSRNLAVGVTAATAAANNSSGTAGASATGSTAKPKIGATNPGTGVTIGTGVDQAAQDTSSTVPAAPRTYLGKARVDIWASPASVNSGQRTSIFWDTTGVYTCTLSSSDRSFTGSSLSGHGATQALTKNTTFMINCETATSSVSNQVVVTVK